jgi:hypothetical protein
MIRHARFHRWRHAERLMHPSEIVIHEVERDDCGFSPFSIDVKPNHGSPDAVRDIAFQKITNRVKGTKMAAEKLVWPFRR